MNRLAKVQIKAGLGKGFNDEVIAEIAQTHRLRNQEGVAFAPMLCQLSAIKCSEQVVTRKLQSKGDDYELIEISIEVN